MDQQLGPHGSTKLPNSRTRGGFHQRRTSLERTGPEKKITPYKHGKRNTKFTFGNPGRAAPQCPWLNCFPPLNETLNRIPSPVVYIKRSASISPGLSALAQVTDQKRSNRIYRVACKFYWPWSMLAWIYNFNHNKNSKTWSIRRDNSKRNCFPRKFR